MTTACPACFGGDLRTFYTVDRVPAASCLMLDDEAAARAFPAGELRIAACGSCGFVTNTAFDPALTRYDDDYEESQGCSPRFRDYAAELADGWVRRYGLVGKTVVELGCGKGEFLATMIAAGVGYGIGVDPAVRTERIDPGLRPRTAWVRGPFPEAMETIDADAVVCRHTMEHIAPVGAWLRSVRAAIGPRTDTVVLFELPDVLRVLREGAFWDVYYEHCSYFSAGSLAGLFRRCGFEPLDVRRTYDDQYLVIEARPVAGSWPLAGDVPDAGGDDRDDVLAAADTFVARMDEARAHWRGRVRKVTADGGRVLLWGASSKAVAFLATLGDDARHVAAAVDINPYKQNRHLAGSGHRVVPPDAVPDLAPDLVIVMNPTYAGEIGRDLDARGVQTALETL
ncbi:class I SAM-dependent methyltransferase [Jiangella rhizosphaerae]|uniref:Methyltransferase domain-containing protein n=1 Tax=Jiangella rhizosphaerae TaxID=2293569 RepID=A0A418KSA7_9ACTN|nr:class I SAM-dependent methyltransferase [Jiangella rhizosphaerae]RIQ25251.1 methyltransferase domain-containing protein [Jiangella rhizosphaerae]